MGFYELVLLGLALSMDAFAVTISNTFIYSDNSRWRNVCMPLTFGIFQGLMPCLGFFLGQLVSDIISQFSGIVTFVILGFIGAKMIWDTAHDNDNEKQSSSQILAMPVLLLQGIATSIDALAVGVSFAALSLNIFSSALIIALTTAFTCLIALLIGRRFGTTLGDRATIVGGTMLILIGLRALLP